MSKHPENKDEWDIPIHVTQPDENLEELAALFEEDPIHDPYMIVCPVCGYDEFEDIRLGGKRALGWVRGNGIKFRWNIKKYRQFAVYDATIFSILPVSNLICYLTFYVK